MKPGVPWSIKGIESETREAAKAAARRSGMTLGQWLNGMIQETAEPPHLVTDFGQSKKSRKSGKKGKVSKSKKGKKGARSDVDTRLSGLADQLSRLAENNQQTAVSRFVDYDDYEQVEETLTALAGRMEANDRANRESFSNINARLDGFDDKLASALDQLEPDESETPEYRALEKSLRSVVEHIEASERKNRDVLDDMQNRIASMAKQAEQSQKTEVQQTAPALTALEDRISDLGEKLDKAARAHSAETRDYVDERLSGLGEQIDAMRHASEGLVKRAETAAYDAAKNEAHAIEKRVAGAISEARALMQNALPANADIGSIRDEIGSLNQRFDDIKSEAASDRELQSLKLAVEQLTSSVDKGIDSQPLAALEQRLGEITQRLDETPPADHMAPQFSELDQRIHALDEKLVAAMHNQNDTQSFSALENHIATVGERLSATEEKLGHLETIEQSITQLYSSIEENRNWTQQTAENAAQAMAEKVMQNIPEPAPVAQVPSAELQALEQGLSAVKQSAEASEKHNQETLEAVHETLEQIITKLAVLEASEPAAAPAPATDPAPQADNAENGWQDAVQSHLNEQVSDTASQQTPEALAQQADVSPAFNPGQVPETPQTVPLADIVQSPDMTVDTDLSTQPVMPEPAPQGDVTQEPAPAPAPDDAAPMDYIAQARLASQTAAAQSSNPLSKGGFIADKIGAGSGDEKSDKAGKKSLFSLSFLKNGKKDTKPDTAATPQPAANENAPNRKRLLLAGLVLLIAAGSFAYSKFSKPPTESASAPAITAPVKKSPAAAAPVKKSQTRSHQTIYAKPPVQKVSLVNPTPVTPNTTRPASRSVMPPSSTLTATNNTSDPILSAPSDPVTTASLPPVAPSVATPPVSSPLHIQRAAPLPKKVPQTTPVETGQKLPPETTGSLELRKAAAAGDASAQFVIASRYINDKKLKRDYAKAALWFQKAASNGLAPAQYRLGTLFERGNGVPKDMNAARLWYERAAEKGNVKAMHNLAVIYAGAKTGKADFAKAANWFNKAAVHGLQDSQYNLAVILERGLAGKSDMKQAFIWYSLAAARGDRDAGIKAHALANHLSDTQRKQALAQIAAWRPQAPRKSGNFVAIKDPKWKVTAAGKAPIKLPPKPNLSGKDLIKTSQSLLSKLGFDVGSPDGVMGSRTGNAVRLFQLQNGLPVNGMVTNDLLQQLQARIATPTA